jgi:hypothetical protein
MISKSRAVTESGEKRRFFSPFSPPGGGIGDHKFPPRQDLPTVSPPPPSRRYAGV